MTNRLASFTLVAALAFGAGCAKFESGSNVTAPSTNSPSTPSGGSSGGSGSGGSGGSTSPGEALVGNWNSQTSFTIPSVSSCTNFQWQIANLNSNSVSGSFSATCDGGIAVSATATGLLQTPTTVAVTITGVALIGAIPACDFTLNGVGTIVDSNTLTIPYTGTTCVGPVHGNETLRRRVAPPTPPAPEPTPTPTTPSDPPAPDLPGDAIDLNGVPVYNAPADIASWAVTTRITRLEMHPLNSPTAGVNLTFSGQDFWPDYTPPGWGGPLQYTVWAVVNIGGRWYTSGFVQMWRGRPNTGAPIIAEFAVNWAYDSRWGPMAGHRPVPGEQMGFFVSAGNARADYGVTSVRERSNVVLISLPGGDDGVSTFSLGRVPRFGFR